MKKYISILSIMTVLLLQSCEDTSRDATIQNEKIDKSTKTVQKTPDALQNKNGESTEEPDNLGGDTGDDEPRRDKQHWRTANDSIGKNKF